MRECRQIRSVPSRFETRAEGDDLFIEGYFSVFGGVYELWDGASETIAPGAFRETLDGDIRALIDHESRLVLGRTTAGTLELREDDVGLWGRVRINPHDQDAMNLYERVRRGDVDQCSFGFDILDEGTETRAGGEIRWTIRKVKLYEVSVVTFPAYEDTSVAARRKDYEEILKRKTQAWREAMLTKLKEWKQYGAQSTDAE